MQSLLISVHDNDFYYTLKAFADFWVSREDDRCTNAELTIEQVKQIWNEMCLGLYLGAQNGFRYRCVPEELEHTKNYLSNPSIWIGAEADNKALKMNYDGNGEYILLGDNGVYVF